jgi:Pin2-interacting protein X1
MSQPAGEETATETAITTATSTTSSSTNDTSWFHLLGNKARKQWMASGKLQEHVAAPTSTFAQQQLQKMGWTAGTGLGKRRTGITTHITVSKRIVEQAGLGTERQQQLQQSTNDTWWKASIGQTLAKLSSSSKKTKSQKESKKRKVQLEFTDEELFQATGGARFGTKGGTLRKAKVQRTESVVSTSVSSSSSSTASVSAALETKVHATTTKQDKDVVTAVVGSVKTDDQDDTVNKKTSQKEEKKKKKKKSKQKKEKRNETTPKDKRKKEKKEKRV